jgi:NhaP-type Na+/H+ and K+/H+ antiporter
MDVVNLPLLATAALVFVSVLAGLFSARIGFSFLLVFLIAGVLAGVDGIGGFSCEDARLSLWVGNGALAVILLDGCAPPTPPSAPDCGPQLCRPRWRSSRESTIRCPST